MTIFCGLCGGDVSIWTRTTKQDATLLTFIKTTLPSSLLHNTTQEAQHNYTEEYSTSLHFSALKYSQMKAGVVVSHDIKRCGPRCQVPFRIWTTTCLQSDNLDLGTERL
jgi:hypothetical protein